MLMRLRPGEKEPRLHSQTNKYGIASRGILDDMQMLASVTSAPVAVKTGATQTQGQQSDMQSMQIEANYIQQQSQPE